MTTPLILDTDDSDMLWKKLDAKKAEFQAKQAAQDTIVPEADSLVSDNLYDRLKSIQDRSSSATQGVIASENTKRQMEAARKAAEYQRQQQQALQQAYNGMNQIASGSQFGQLAGGSVGGAGWGGGGAQGVANVLRQAGFPESAIPTMMAIGMAESSWNPGASHKNANGSIDQGLFQINSIHRGNSWYPQNPMDPYQSAVAAYNIWKGAGGTYRDWTVYNSGAYRKFLPSSVPPIQPYVANTSKGLSYAQVGQAQQYAGVPAIYNGGNYGPVNTRGMAGNTAAARDFVKKTFGISNIGGFGGGSVSGSDHPKGKAIDVMIPDYRSSGGISKGTSIANWFIANPKVFGVKYIIWRDRIWQNGVWKAYGHPSMHNDTGQHRDHVHVSFL